MARHSFPKYRLHKGSGQAFVQLMGRRYYLGKHGSDASREAYSRFIAELVSKRQNARRHPIYEARRLSHCGGDRRSLLVVRRRYYRGGFLANIKSAIGVIRDLYGRVRAPEFGPRALQAIQAHLVTEGHSRSHVNKSAAIIKRMFRWAAAQELIDTAIYQALTTVGGLRKGRTEARETKPVGPVPDQVVDATLPFSPRIVSDMVRIHRLVGARPGEICAMWPCDIDQSEEVWAYSAGTKNSWTTIEVRDGARGPLAVQVVKTRVQAKSDRRRNGPEELLVVVREEQSDGTMKHDYHLANAAHETPLAELTRVVKAEHL